MTRLREVGLWLLIPLMLFGMGVGGLMTWHHDTQLYGAAAEQGELVGCTESATVNCDIVNTSAWSELFGVPIATLSIAAYAAVLVLAILALRRDAARGPIIGAGVFAVVCSAFLLWVSKTELGYVCAWCIRLYGVNVGILVLSALGGRPPRPDRALLGTMAAVTVGLVVLAAGGERLYRGTLSGSGGPDVAAHGTDHTRDVAGEAPSQSFAVKTEDGRDTSFTLDPDDAWIGNRDATVTVVMFGDFECGYCKRSSAELARLEATYADRVLFVFKHFPMDPACNPGVKNKKHKSACLAAKASVCAQEQGVFWAFHDLAYKNQHQLDPDSLTAYAEHAGVDPTVFDTCMGGDEANAVVRHDAEIGASLDIHGTPRIFVNGQLYRSGTSAEVMARAIEVALGTKAADAARNAAALREPVVLASMGDVPPMEDLGAFRIDSFEAAIDDGSAVSAKHRIPALRSSWFDASAACEKAGKRMCTEAEWITACQGALAVDDDHDGQFADDMIEGTAYPYGDLHEEGRCWDDREGPTFRPVYTGELPGCATAAGVYDLTGNLEEWVGATADQAVLLGGAWDTSEDHARCYRRNDSFGAGFASPRTGFRCCE